MHLLYFLTVCILISLLSFGCTASEDVFSKLTSLQMFVRDLHWPDEEMAEHLNRRLKLMASDMIESVVNRYYLVSLEMQLNGAFGRQ